MHLHEYKFNYILLSLKVYYCKQAQTLFTKSFVAVNAYLIICIKRSSGICVKTVALNLCKHKSIDQHELQYQAYNYNV